MLVVFEGIDGSGKTTVSNRVAKLLRNAGLSVRHIREGGTFASRVTQNIREFGRDARNIDLAPYAELLLYVARDAQLLDEVTRPALAAADVVIADRFLYSAEVLARFGRGLPDAQVRAVVDGAARGVVPDLVVFIDVDPTIASARRRIAKIVTPDPRSPSRKGQAGVGLLHRMRDGYRRLAAVDTGRWLVIDNSDDDLDAVVDHAARAVLRMCHGEAAGCATAGDAPRAAPAPHAWAPGGASSAFLDWVDRRARREPALAAYMLTGLAGEAAAQRRRALAERAPEVTAWSLRGLTDPESWRLRRALAERVPLQVAASLGAPTPHGRESEALRAALAARAPEAVLASTWGAADAPAYDLRQALYPVAPDAVMASLGTLGDMRAWELRMRWLCERGGTKALEAYPGALAACRSVAGLDDDAAWGIRDAARAEAPVASLASLAGLVSERAWRLREQGLASAPKAVLSTLRGLDDERAWDLRETAAPLCREALDGMWGADGARAWRLRDRCVDLWPGAVVKTLGPLVETPRGAALLARQLESHPGDISVLRHAAALELGKVCAGEQMVA